MHKASPQINSVTLSILISTKKTLVFRSFSTLFLVYYPSNLSWTRWCYQCKILNLKLIVSLHYFFTHESTQKIHKKNTDIIQPKSLIINNLRHKIKLKMTVLRISPKTDLILFRKLKRPFLYLYHHNNHAEQPGFFDCAIPNLQF